MDQQKPPPSPGNQEPPSNGKEPAIATTSAAPFRPNTLNGYKPIHPIGTTAYSAVVNGGVVYKALHYSPGNQELIKKQQSNEPFVAIKSLSPLQDHYSIVEQRSKNLDLDHPNILKIQEELSVDDTKYLWVTFPFMNEGSLRSLMGNFFKDGLSEELIAIVLREALMGLAYLHQQGDVHREFDSSHIYFDSDVPAVKVGFLGTIYEHNSEYSQPNDALSESDVSVWAAATEIASLAGEYTEKSDVWLVGITGMELAFGGVWVRNRRELEELIEEVVGDGGGDGGKGIFGSSGTIMNSSMARFFAKFGDKGRDTQSETSKKKSLFGKCGGDGGSGSKNGAGKNRRAVDKFLKKMLGMSFSSSSKGNSQMDSVSETVSGPVVEPRLMAIDRNLSQTFKDLLWRCLDEDPEERPSVNELLQHEFFKNCNDLSYLQDAVKLAKSQRA